MNRRPRLLVVASTFPIAAEDATPAFVLDLAIEQVRDFDTVVLAPRVPGPARHEDGYCRRGSGPNGGDVYALNDPLSRRVKSAVLRSSRAVTAMNADMRTRLLARARIRG